MEVNKKFDQYEVAYKKLKCRVVVFPDANLWMYDNHPCEETYDIDGDIQSMRLLAEAFIIAIYEPEVLIYLPTKKTGATFNMVLSGSEITGFKPSVWYKLKAVINMHTRVKDFKLRYDREKLSTYCEAELSKQVSWHRKLNSSIFSQVELGDTVFCHYNAIKLSFTLNIVP